MSSSECVVCVSLIRTIKSIISCPSCKFEACESCYLQYFLNQPFQIHCMSCKVKWESHFVFTVFSSPSLKYLIQKRKKIQSRMEPEKEPDIQIKQQIREKFRLKKQLENEINLLKNQLKDKNAELSFCPNSKCDGFIKYGHSCFKCKTEICFNCKDLRHEGDCSSPSMLFKRCPSCKMGIERESGCSNMFCTFCLTGFHWKNGKTMETIENPHFWQYRNKMEEEKKSIRLCFERDLVRRDKWLYFCDLLYGVDKERRQWNTGTTEKKRWINEAILGILENFVKEGKDLVKKIVISKDYELDFDMLHLMKKVNDDLMVIGEKTNSAVPRIFGWKLVKT